MVWKNKTIQKWFQGNLRKKERKKISHYCYWINFNLLTWYLHLFFIFYLIFVSYSVSFYKQKFNYNLMSMIRLVSSNIVLVEKLWRRAIKLNNIIFYIIKFILKSVEEKREFNWIHPHPECTVKIWTVSYFSAMKIVCRSSNSNICARPSFISICVQWKIIQVFQTNWPLTWSAIIRAESDAKWWTLMYSNKICSE